MSVIRLKPVCVPADVLLRTIEASMLSATKPSRSIIKVDTTTVSSLRPINVRASLDNIILSDRVERGLDALADSGLLHALLPEVNCIVGFGGGTTGHKDLWDHTKRVVASSPRDLVVRYAALFHDVGKPSSYRRIKGEVTFRCHEERSRDMFLAACKRFDPAMSDLEAPVALLIETLGRAEQYDSDWSDSAVRRLSKDLGQHRQAYLSLVKADCTTGNAAKHARIMALAGDLERRMRELAAIDALPPALPKGLGLELCAAFERQPGKWLGDLMDALKTRVEAGELSRGREAAYYVDASR